MKKRIRIFSITLLLMLFSTFTFADVVIVVNPDSQITSISQKQVKRIFLGKIKKVNGKNIVAVDQNEDSVSRIEFYKSVVKKSESQLKSYWSTRIFSGKGTPPKSVKNDSEVKSWVANNIDAIGYIDMNLVDESVVVVYPGK